MLNFTGWKIKRITKKIKAMQANRVSNQPTDEVLKKEIAYYFELAALFNKLKGHKKYPYAAVMEEECYLAAASLENAEAHYQLGKMYLEEGRFRQELEAQGIYNSENNTKQRNAIYEAAHLHLLAADKLQHIQAKRLRGLSIINGWGTESDKDRGFELVVASIDQEESWDKVPQIFAAIGLNKPEFFAAIMKRRKDTPSV